MYELRRVLVSAVLVGVLAILVRAIVSRLVIKEYEAGLLYRNGRFARQLGPGAWWILPFLHSIRILDLRGSILNITGQEVLSADNVGLKISMAVTFKVVDPVAAAHTVADYRDHLHVQAQLALRTLISSTEVETLLSRRNESGARLLDQVGGEAAKTGLCVQQIEIKDVMFPGELKGIFATVVKARYESSAMLERSRAETAAMRNLANVVGLMEKHPALLKLRWIQSLESGTNKGNNVWMLGKAGGILPAQEE